MSRLASLYGPSTPSPSPVRSASKSGRSPSSSQGPLESTYHRKTRVLLVDLRTTVRTWDDLVLHDGLKAAKSLVDLRTQLDNELASLPPGVQPRRRLVGPKLILMEQHISELEIVIHKLEKQFAKMNTVADSLESLMIEAHKMKGWKWVSQEPLWCTWPLEKFVTTIPTIIPLYHRSLHQHRVWLQILRDHSSPFELCRDTIEEWVSQPDLQGGTWSELEDIFSIEVEKWDKH